MVIQIPLYSRVRSSCSECGYLITQQAMECSTQSTKIVKYRAKLFATPNITTTLIDTIQAWTRRETLTVAGLRLYFENACPVMIESFDSPLLNCFEDGSNQSASSTTVLAIIASLVCVTLFILLAILTVYIVYKRYLPQTCKNLFRYIIMYTWHDTDIVHAVKGRSFKSYEDKVHLHHCDVTTVSYTLLYFIRICYNLY